MKTLEEIAKKIRRVNDLNGWTIPENVWEHEYIIPSKLVLLHSEVSEALEGFRNNNFENFVEELADIQIRLLDLVSGMDIIDKFQETIIMKMRKNEARGYKHGNKRI